MATAGAALAFSVITFFVEQHHKRKYDERLAKLEIDEKEKSLEEEKKAFIRCTPLEREEGKWPRFLVENIGKHAANSLTLQMPQFFQIVEKKLFPFAHLDPGQGVTVYYQNATQGVSSISLNFTYSDGRGEQEQEVIMQIR